MTVNVKSELTAYLLSIDDCRYAVCPLVKQSQNRLIHIVVNKDNPFLRTLNQIGHKSIGIIDLPIIENALFGLRITLVQSAEHLINTLVCLLQVLLHLQLMVLHC